ncbi:MAG TPA: hypothetical protein PK668_13495 [Myxococcota bacterium]|nr:hypothetical protein [Myxococcota bacterium]HRY94123.1 hypothetical protein [Myxococcota bacterium]HSA23805.1 hypothetical protein [Myxococcota bacterium]
MAARVWLTALCLSGLVLAGVALAGPGAPAAAPADAPAAAAPEAGGLDEKALAEIALEQSRLRDELAAAEARLGVLAEKLFGARLTVTYRGELDAPFQLARVELWLDGALTYAQDFQRPPSVQLLQLFDGHLPPGRHLLLVRVLARGPGEPEGAPPGYLAGSGLAVHLREGAVTRARFEAEQDGDPPDTDDLAGEAPEGSWDVDIEASFTTGR